ncbi:MAG TPA: DUF1003 domain-containing protein [Acetobacteraceae bacterium]|jgi:uncharacterized membrane protein|nr:DUF1003 domain-containing protein [Acetobacteraceae bacterium]
MRDGHTPRVVARNIEEVVRLEQEQRRRSPPFSRIAEAVAGFAGSRGFVVLHALVVLAYVLMNSGLVPGITPFDPFPYGLLGMAFSLEGVLLAAFVLMKQNRMSAQAEQRAHLDLQVSLLAEQEISKAIRLLQLACTRLGIEQAADEETTEMAENTAVAGLAQQLQERLPRGT